MNQASLLTRVAATVAAVVLLLAAPSTALATAAVAGPSAPPGLAEESKPIDLTGASTGGTTPGGGGGSLVRTIVGLAIVIGVIYGVAWVLRQVKQSRQPRATGSGLAPLASVPLGSNRSVQLVRAGTDLVLLGVSENGVVPIRTYSEAEARAAGLVDDDGMLILPADDDTPRPARKRLALPAPRTAPRAKLALPAPKDAIETIRAWTVRG